MGRVWNLGIPIAIGVPQNNKEDDNEDDGDGDGGVY